MSGNSINILGNALYSLRPFEKICLYSFDVRRRQRIYEEFYNRLNKYEYLTKEV
jgi:hypothetical protein